MRMNMIAALTGAALLLAACEKKPEGAPAAGTGTGGSGTGLGDTLTAAKDAAASGFAKLRDDAVAALEPRLESAKAEVTKLKDKVAALPATIKPTVESSMTEVEKQLGNAGDQLGKLKTATADTWQSISSELGATLDKLGASIKDLASQFPS
jgi:gas vesicle protein